MNYSSNASFGAGGQYGGGPSSLLTGKRPYDGMTSIDEQQVGEPSTGGLSFCQFRPFRRSHRVVTESHTTNSNNIENLKPEAFIAQELNKMSLQDREGKVFFSILEDLKN